MAALEMQLMAECTSFLHNNVQVSCITIDYHASFSVGVRGVLVIVS